jgi:predicted outer membrane lipoprotein
MARLVNGDLMRWLLGVVVAAVVAYFTTINAIQAAVVEVKTRQETQFLEVLRQLEDIKTDIRELRRAD